MNKTCNLDTVKNTPSGARRDTLRAEYYYIKIVGVFGYYSIIQNKSLQCIIDIIYDELEYYNLSEIHKAVIYAYYSDGSSRPLFMFKNDVINHNFTIVNLTRKK